MATLCSEYQGLAVPSDNPAREGAETVSLVDIAAECCELEAKRGLNGKDAIATLLCRTELWHPERGDITEVTALRKEAQEVSATAFHEVIAALRCVMIPPDDGRAQNEQATLWIQRVGRILDELRAGAAAAGRDTPDVGLSISELWSGAFSNVSAPGSVFEQALRHRMVESLGDLSALEQILFDEGRASREERALSVLRRLTNRLESEQGEPDLNQTGLNGPIEQALAGLRVIRTAQCLVKATTDLPRILADGLVRTRVHYISPENLPRFQRSRGWQEISGEPVADLAIVGGGPGGLAAAYHAGRLGLNTVLLEGGYLGQAFSDARAKPVHAMRTNATGSSLFRPGIVSRDVEESVGLPAIMKREQSRVLAEEARKQFQELTGRHFVCDLPGVTEAGNRDVPITRGELFHSLMEVAAAAASYPSVLVLEQAPVTKVHKRPDGLFAIESAAGHRQLARRLIVGTGFVGSDGEYARNLPDLVKLCAENGEKYIQLYNENDLVRQSQNILELTAELRAHRGDGSPVSRQVIMSDVALGHQEAQLLLSLLPAKSGVAVVGSGESAAKAALEVLAQNPDVTVSLFVKSELEPAQSQTPSSPGNRDVMQSGIFDQRLGEVLLERWMQGFGTPITPATMLDLLKETQRGRVRVFELGAHFSEKCLDICCVEGESCSRTRISIDGNNREVEGALARQLAEWQSCGLLTDTTSLLEAGGELAHVDCIITAPGYDRSRLRKLDSLTQQLLSQGLIELVDGGGKGRAGEIVLDSENRLTSKCDSALGFIGAGNLATASDGGLTGIGTRAYFLVEEMAAHLADDTLGETTVEQRRKQAREAANELFLNPPEADEIMRAPLPSGSISDVEAARIAAGRCFLGVPKLIELETKRLTGHDLTPPERLVLMRGHQVQHRVWQLDASFSTRVPTDPRDG